MVGSSGSYTLNGGLLIAPSGEIVSYAGSGSVTQGGGTNSASSLYIGDLFSTSGSYTLNGGSLAAPLGEFVGYGGSGSVTQGGGTNSASFLYIGDLYGSTGSYTLNGGLLIAPSGEYIGAGGIGSFTQTGGTNTTFALSIGPGSVYLLNGGLLQLNSLTVSSSGNAFSANAGSMQVLGTFTPIIGSTFGSRLINDGSLVLNNSFFPGGGLQNDTSFIVPAGVTVGSPTGSMANTVDNEGMITLNGGTLAGGSGAMGQAADRQ